MPKRTTSFDDHSSRHSSKALLAYLFAKTNRGLLLDIVVFTGNVYLIRYLTSLYIGVFNEFSENPLAMLALGLTFLAMWILPAAGAVLKRWNFHRRLSAAGKKVGLDDNKLATGCLFNPIFYFCLNLVITSALFVTLGDFIFGKRLMQTPEISVPLIILSMALTIFQTYLIYSYFLPPKKAPRWPFLLTRQSETLGDVCFFLNMILFQVFWNMLTFAPLGHPTSFVEFGGRLFFLCFIALLIYFPPRMFYLAEDINRRSTWLMMLLANSPVIIRVLIGTGSNSTGY